MVKKFLAVLLAVIVAVSAMSINVISVGFNALEDDTSGDTADNETQKYYTQVQVSFEFPIYTELALGSKIQLTLPRYFGGNMIPYSDTYKYTDSGYVNASPLSVVDWSIIVNDKTYALEMAEVYQTWGNPATDPYAVFTQIVSVGAFGHDWNRVTNDAEIPLSSDESTTIRLVADLTIDGANADWRVDTSYFKYVPDNPNFYNGCLGYVCKADFYNPEANLVGTTFMADWNITKAVEEDPAAPKCTHPTTHKEWTDSYHWHVCDYCGEPLYIAKHTIINGKCFCGYDESASSEPGTPKCDHAQSVTASDAHVHWYICDTCGEKWGIEDHTFEDGICTACGFEEILKYDFNGDGQLTLQDAIDTLKKVMHVE